MQRFKLIFPIHSAINRSLLAHPTWRVIELLIQYDNYLNGSIGVSPWFFTHYNPQTFNKNWLYLSDTLLIDRWNEILNLQPQLVELITWNDFGESHYIGITNSLSERHTYLINHLGPLHPERPSVYAPSGDSDGAIQWVSRAMQYFVGAFD
jgi:glucan endo-1,3-alpha-glucosidase